MKVDLVFLINGVSHTEGGLRVRGIICGDVMAQNLTFVVFRRVLENIVSRALLITIYTV